MSETKQDPIRQEGQDLSELLRIRRDKLSALRAEGRDPFRITTCERDTLAKQIHDHFDEMENQDAVWQGAL